MNRSNATPSAHAHQDKLLDFAYGELPADEARRVEQHVQGCARCNEELGSIRGVRLAFAKLPEEPAPDAGLESLLAYAGQKARQNAAGPAPASSKLRLWLFGLAGVSALGLIGVVGVNMTMSSPEANAASAELAATQARREAPAQAASAEPPFAPEKKTKAFGDAPAPSVDKLAEARKQDVAEQAIPLAEASPGGLGGAQFNSDQRLGTQDLVGKAARSKMKGGRMGVTRVDVDPSYRKSTEDGSGGGLSMRAGGVGSSYGVGAGPSTQGASSTADALEAAPSEAHAAEPLAQAQTASAPPPPPNAPLERDEGSAEAVERQRVDSDSARSSAMKEEAAFAGAPSRAPSPSRSVETNKRSSTRSSVAYPAAPPPAATRSGPMDAPEAAQADDEFAATPASVEAEVASLRARVRTARGTQLGELLTRLCELEHQTGDPRAAATCGRVMKQFAGTDFARRASERLSEMSDTAAQGVKK